MSEQKRNQFLNFVEDDYSNWLNKARYRRENRNWLIKSKLIALKILTQLDNLGINKIDLSERSGIPIEEINLIVKGGQDLTLSTIATLEDVLGIVLTDTPANIEKKPPTVPTSRVSGPIIEGTTKGNVKPTGSGTQGPPPPPPRPFHTSNDHPKESEVIKIEPEYYKEGSTVKRKQKSKWVNWSTSFNGFRWGF